MPKQKRPKQRWTDLSPLWLISLAAFSSNRLKHQWPFCLQNWWCQCLQMKAAMETSQKLQDESACLHLGASRLMYACPRLSLGAHGSYLSLSGSSGNQHCHTGSLLDHSHRVSLWPLVTTQGSSSREADLTHSPQCTATSHMPASPVILTQH